jgi:hypothetical protein
VSPDRCAWDAPVAGTPHDRGVTDVRELPGVRLIRPLAREPHRESWLVRLEGDEPCSAVLVRARDAEGARRLRIEVAALHRARGAGVVPLLDVVDDDEGVAALLAHVTGPRLATLLGERERWDAGETVTVLRPVVDAVARMHRMGVAHGAVGPAQLVISESGGVLVDAARAELFATGVPEAVLARIDAVGRDRDGTRALALELLRRVSASRARAAHALADAVEHCGAAEVLDTLLAGLDDLAAPTAIARRDAEPRGVSRPVETRVVPVVRGAIGESSVGERRGRRWRELTARIDGARARLAALPAVRRRLLLGAGAAVTTGAILLALPTGGGARQGGTIASVPPSPDLADAVASSDADDAAMAGDDPIAAAIALLERREECFAELSLLCLEQVDQQASSALQADREAMRDMQAGGEAEFTSVDPIDARLVERLGDSVVVELGPKTNPASLLLMRSEAGWRIRDWLGAGRADQIPS